MEDQTNLFIGSKKLCSNWKGCKYSEHYTTWLQKQWLIPNKQVIIKDLH